MRWPFSRKQSSASVVEKAVDLGDIGWQNVGSVNSRAGVAVSSSSAMSIPAFYAGVRNISEDIARTPVVLKRYAEDGTISINKRHPLYKVFNRRPNVWMTAFELKAYVMQCILLNGNSYCLKVINGRGEVTELIPIHPSRVCILQTPSGELFYQISDSSNFESAVTADGALKNGIKDSSVIPSQYIWHMKSSVLSGNGIYGLSVISAAKDAIGLGIAQQRHASAQVKNDATPGVVLRHPEKLSKEAAARLAESWKNAFSSDGLGRAAVLQEGMDVTPITMSSSEQQFIEQRKFTVLEIARLLRMPPSMLQDDSHATYSNSENATLNYLTQTLSSHIDNFESSVYTHLLNDTEASTMEIDFDVTHLLRADMESRMDAWSKAVQFGIYTPNEARAKEGLSPKENGDELYQQTQMASIGFTERNAAANREIQERNLEQSSADQKAQQAASEAREQEEAKNLQRALRGKQYTAERASTRKEVLADQIRQMFEPEERFKGDASEYYR